MEVHELFLHLLFVVSVSFPYFGHHRLELPHFLHGLIAFMCEGPKQYLDENSKQDDRNAIIMDIFIEETKDYQKGFGNNVKPPEVDSLTEFFVYGL